MFDFPNYAYSAILSILSMLFGLSYPLVIGCIEKIDNKYKSTILSERFLRELCFKWFKFLLVLNLIAAVLFPFIMDGNEHNRLIIGIQCVLVTILVSCAFTLFSRIIAYYNPSTLQGLIVVDFKRAQNRGNKDGESRYFTQFIDLAPVLLSSADDNQVQSVYKFTTEYVTKKYKECKGEECVFDQYYYEGISRINESLCKGERKPVSVNNGNSLLTSLIFHNTIVSDTSYRYLWRNLRIQLFYGRDEWIMEYWKAAVQKFSLLMRKIDPYSINENTEKPYTQEEITANKKHRVDYMEFHIMLCAMLLQEKKYDLLSQLLAFTNSEPPSYPLVPSSISEIVAIFNQLNNYGRSTPFYFESKYQMPKMHGITDGKIIGAANRYLALLAYRIYAIRWSYGSDTVLSAGGLPNTLSELNNLKESLETLKRWLIQLSSNQEILDVVFIKDIASAMEAKNEEGFPDIKSPTEIADEMIEEINTRMEHLRKTQSLNEEKVIGAEGEVRTIIMRGMAGYGDLLGRRFKQDRCYNLNSSVSMPFPNTAFIDDPDIGHAGISECMGQYLLHNFHHMFASGFFQEHSVPDYRISSEFLFDALDKLSLDDSHYIVAFGIYFDYFLNITEGLIKENDRQYTYKGIKILSLDCPTDYFSQLVYVMKFDDRPFLDFGEPSDEDLKKLELKKYDDLYGLWMSIIKVIDKPEILEEPLKSDLGDSADKHSLFTAIWAPKLFFKPEKYEIVSMKVKYRTMDEGEYESIDVIKPFSKE